ncbi:MAG: ribulose 1,5-bisphosphate carboxylase [Acidobacteria bacterium]|nr:ribulose 1,5-bisphosphate carboxylase [Acidobacteriota bacterium]
MDEMQILSQPVALPEGVDFEEYIVATYLAAYPAAVPLPKLAPFLAVEQSTGTWVPVPGETPEMRARHVAKVIGVYEVPDLEFEIPAGTETRNWLIQVAFPEVNIGEQIPMLLTAVVGNISMGGKIKLVDVRFPRKYIAGFKGPKFGIDGVRERLGVYKRPILNNMIKPCTGYPVEVGVQLFREAALGGSDIVKDDELIADASFNSVADRVKAYMRVEKEVYEETGERTLYSVNISDGVPKVFENARRAIEMGANAIMINYLAVGLPVMQALAEDPAIDVPILAHMDVAGAFYMSPWHGISSHLMLGKLPRLAGADIVVIPAPYGKAPVIDDKFMSVARNLTFPLHGLKPTVPMASGGIAPSMVPQIMGDLGNDIVIAAGGSIHAHPGGPRAGAKAFRQAIDATMAGIPIRDAVANNPELATAVQLWGDPFGKGVRQ